MIEKNGQILTPFDNEMTTPIVQELKDKGVTLLLGQTAEAIEQTADGLNVCLNSGQRLPGQLVVFRRNPGVKDDGSAGRAKVNEFGLAISLGSRVLPP